MSEINTKDGKVCNLKSPTRWYGSKYKMASKLKALMPEHENYVEVFAGGASLLFAREPKGLEALNDLDSGIVNFYRVLRDPEKFKAFQQKVELTPYSAEEFRYCKETWRDCGDDVERAYRWYIVNRMCFGGVMSGGFGRSKKSGRKGMGANVSSFLNTIDALPQIHDRLRGVQVEHSDFRDVINIYDRPETLFYLDPPYVKSTRKSKEVYDHEMSDSDHEDLVDILLGIKGTAMLSGYNNPIYKTLEFAGWKRHDFDARCCVSNSAQSDDKKRTESVWVRN